MKLITDRQSAVDRTVRITDDLGSNNLDEGDFDGKNFT